MKTESPSQTQSTVEKPAPRQKKLGVATRDAYGQVLVELGHSNPRIVAVDADLSKSTKSGLFAKAFPDRFFNCGIAEANMVSVAAGLASCGKIPFASSFASFLLCKSFDQLRMSVANPFLNVKIVGSHGGISLGEDGASQQSVEDFALACALPKFSVLSPADEVSCRALVRLAAAHVGPVYIRTGRPKAPILYTDADTFQWGAANKLVTGEDVTIIANGLLVWEALIASDLLRERGISAGVIDLHTLKPIDEAAIIAAAEESGAIVTAEEHLLTGGLSSLVAQVLSQHRPTPMASVGIADTYAESGTPTELLEKYGLTATQIVQAAETVLKRKK
ncbi:MAG: transketolase family protein [Nitrospirae bacterium]|nr:transketolase family protein [Candidatus Manganitrophaceae bacterium]